MEAVKTLRIFGPLGRHILVEYGTYVTGWLMIGLLGVRYGTTPVFREAGYVGTWFSGSY